MNKLLGGLGAAFLSTATGAAMAGSAPPASFEQALQQAVANRTELAIEREKIRAADGRVGEMAANFKPTVALTSAVEHVHRYDPFSGVTASTNIGGQPVSVDVAANPPRYQGRLGVEVAYNLYKGGADRARLEEARQLARAAQAQYALETKKVMADAAAACAAWMKAALVQRQAARAVEMATLEAAQLQQRLAAGNASALDAKEADIRLKSGQIDLKAAARALREAQRKYCSALNTECAAPDAELAAPELNLRMPDMTALYSRFGVGGNPDAVKAEASTQAARQRIALARASYAPVVDLYYSLSNHGYSNEGFGDARSGFKREQSAVGVRLTWTLFDGFRSASYLQQEVAATEQMRLRQTMVGGETASRQVAAQEELAGLEEQLTLEKMQLELAQSKQAIGAQRLRLKLISDLDQARLAFAVDAQENRIASLTLDVTASKLKLALQ